MRILRIHNYYQNQGGEDIFFHKLNKLLTQKNHQLKLYTKHNKSIKNNPTSLLQTSLNLFYNPTLEQEITQTLKNFKPDLAHIHNTTPLISFNIYKILNRLNIPIIQHVHNYRFMFPKSILIQRGPYCTYCLEKSRIQPLFVHSCSTQSHLHSIALSLAQIYHTKILNSFKFINQYIFPSNFTRNFYLKNSPIQPTQATTIHHFVPQPKPLKPKAKTKKPNFLFVGRISKEKGIQTLLKTFSQLNHLNLTIIGNGPLQNLVKKTMQTHLNIKYLGHIPNQQLSSYYQRAKFTIVPSNWLETITNVTIESFSYKTPVIAPKTGPFPELINHKENGLIYSPNTPKTLKNTILDSLKLPYQKLSDNAYQSYQKNHTLPVYYQKLQKLYLTTIKNSA